MKSPAKAIKSGLPYGSSAFVRDLSIHSWEFIFVSEEVWFWCGCGVLADACRASGSAGAVPGSGLRPRVQDAKIS